MNHAELLRALTLGTARQHLPSTITDWLKERDVVDPTADPAEQLLAIYAIHERLHRFAPHQETHPEMAPPPPEEHPIAPARLARALELIFNGPYADVLPEALDVLERRQLLVPPALLPALLDRAATTVEIDLAQSMVRAGGHRADWLTRYKPEWAALGSHYNLPAAWKKAVTPADRLTLLRRWRHQDPAAARAVLSERWPELSPTNQESLLSALAIGLSPADQPWLRERLGPKRKGVRRAILTLLLRSGEEQAQDELTEVAVAAFDDNGQISRLLTEPRAKDILQAYGGQPKGSSLAEYLHRILPSTLLADLVAQDLEAYWTGLPESTLHEAALAVLDYRRPEELKAFLRFAVTVNPIQLPLKVAAQICAALPQTDFLGVFHGLLDQEQNVLHLGGVPRILALARQEAWSARITKAFVHQLTGTLREVRDLPYSLQKDLVSHWQLAIPLFDVSTFSWLRTHLNTLTERADLFGKLATTTLQTTHFRRQLGE
ncbi:MAG: DUF5691 domain-containing protein [Bacteroidota bacterium]